MTFPRVVLAINAAIFTAFGLWALADPIGLLALVDVSAPTPTARADVRATYAGFVLGFALFLWLCVRKPEWCAAGNAACALALTGFALARVLSAALDGPVNPVLFALAGGEAVGAVMALVAWRRARLL